MLYEYSCTEILAEDEENKMNRNGKTRMKNPLTQTLVTQLTTTNTLIHKLEELYVCLLQTETQRQSLPRGREGAREEGREGGRERGREGEREGGRERGRKGEGGR